MYQYCLLATWVWHSISSFMTLLRSLGTLGHIHILWMEGQSEDFLLSRWILTPLSKVDIDGSANYNEKRGMKWRDTYSQVWWPSLADGGFSLIHYSWLHLLSCLSLLRVLWLVSLSLRHCVFEFNNLENECSQPRQDSKCRTGAVIKNI